LRRAGAGAWLVAALAGCAPPVWDVGPLAAREPRLRAQGAGRLGDSTPYLLPIDGELVFFLCRWPTPARVPVSLPPEATPAQRAALEAALAAWEGADLGVRFERGAPAGRGIELRFVADSARGAGRARTATTVADCALDAADGARGDRLAAQLVAASIELRAENVDPLGRRVLLSDAELAGAALHELGHALGFQGHVRVGESAMRFQVDAVRSAGRRVLAEPGFRDPALSALYAVPSGAVVGRLRVPPDRTLPVDRMLAWVRSGELAGPLARMGDLEGQLLFRDAAGAAYALWLREVAAALAGQPAALEVLLGPRSQRRLSPRSRRAGSRARAQPAPHRPARARATPRRVGTA
jgi:hypothetical protein